MVETAPQPPGYGRAMSPLRIRPLGGAPGCLLMILISLGLSVMLTILLNLGR